MSAPYQHAGKQRRNEPRERPQRVLYASDDDSVIWALRSIKTNNGAEQYTATQQILSDRGRKETAPRKEKETQSERKQRLERERKEMAEALRFARVNISKENKGGNNNKGRRVRT